MPNRRHRAFAVGSAILLALAPMFVADARAGSGKWIVDQTSQCGTSDPFLVPGEQIRWYGACANGKLQGQGTLIWYRDGVETERNEGTFHNGEFHGDVLTTFPDGERIYGQYVEGVRHGEFMIVRVDGQPIRAVYNKGVLQSQNAMTTAEAAAFKRYHGQNHAAVGAGTPVPAPMPMTASMSGNGSAPRAVTAPEAVKSTESAATTAAGDSSSGSGFGKALSYLNPLNWELNPLKWGVVDKVTGLFSSNSGGPKEVATAAPVPKQAAPVPQPRPVAQAQPVPNPAMTPPQAAPMTRTGATAPAVTPRAARPTPAAPQRPQLPVAQSPSYVNTAPPGFTSAKNLYDMSVFLNEPHPFATTPTAKASIPIVDGVSQYMSKVFQATETDTAGTPPPPVVLANGWHSEPPPSYAPAFTPAYTPTAVNLGAPTASQNPPLADTMFTRAYQLERAGNYSGAEALYEQIVMQQPSSPTARLANDRLNAMRTAASQSMARAGLPPAPEIKPATNYVTIREGDRVIAVNSPFPDTYSRGRATGMAGLSQIHASNFLDKKVCSRPELYDGGAKWCGFVRSDEGTHFVVEVRDVQLGSFGMIGISRSTCTGGVFLNWFSRGTMVRVPRNCFNIDG